MFIRPKFGQVGQDHRLFSQTIFKSLSMRTFVKDSNILPNLPKLRLTIHCPQLDGVEDAETTLPH